jgi:ATP-dependent RNA helicase DOB1
VYPVPPGEDNLKKAQPLVVPILLDTVDSISKVRLHLPNDLRPLAQREIVAKSIGEVKKRLKGKVELLDPVEHMGIKDEKFKTLVEVSC